MSVDLATCLFEKKVSPILLYALPEPNRYITIQVVELKYQGNKQVQQILNTALDREVNIETSKIVRSETR